MTYYRSEAYYVLNNITDDTYTNIEIAKCYFLSLICVINKFCVYTVKMFYFLLNCQLIVIKITSLLFLSPKHICIEGI